jgi:uncharacterized protein YutE (UPF0331/DUF86 family)
MDRLLLFTIVYSLARNKRRQQKRMENGAINPNLIGTKISEIQQSLERLRDISSKGKEVFLNEPNLKDSAKYRLITAIEAAISICNHIAAREFKRAPQSYSDCFMILHELGVISGELAGRLGDMARFRNMLVHIYWEINDEKIYTILRDELVDLENYIKEIVNYLDKK